VGSLSKLPLRSHNLSEVYAHGWGLSMDLILVSDVYYHAKHPPRVLWKCIKSPLGFFNFFS
jgi:hypothetical protein